MEDEKFIVINDVTLRDGMHALSHQFEISDMVKIAEALDDAGVDIIEVSHGDGLAGNAINYGFSKYPEMDYIKAVASALKRSKPGALLLPGIGTIEDLEMAIESGIKVARIATHCTEADISQQHIEYAKSRGLDVVGFLMMAHMISPGELVVQAKLMESYGADCVYIVDSAGAMLPQDVADRIKALRDNLSCQVGFHAHHNLSLGVANSLVAVQNGAERIDASLCGLGAGAGNAPLEVLIAVFNKAGVKTGCELYKLMDAAEEIVRPLMRRMDREVKIDRDSLSLGYAGVYSSFLLHAKKAGEKFGIDTRDILVELGRRKMVGGQEDMIIDVAVDMAKRKKLKINRT
jgi:4-hydroxy 2-oxovalerate aldolase